MEDQVKKIKKLIEDAEKKAEDARQMLRELTGEREDSAFAKTESAENADSEKIIEGWFDGQSMYDETGKLYPVPANYASKSKLVEGDKLKLTITEDGTFLFKQIGPVDRKRVIGALQQDINTRGYIVDVDGKHYKVLFASITYFKAKEGDSVVLLIPKDAPAAWGAIENVLGSGGEIPQGGQNISSDNKGGASKPKKGKNADSFKDTRSLDEIIGEAISSTPGLLEEADQNKQKKEIEW